MDMMWQELSGFGFLAWPVILVRLAGAIVLAGLIGVERELVDKSAGLRTHMLTGLASCLYSLVMLALLTMTAEQGEHIRADPVRLVEAVTQGVAFLAAGLIIFARGEVRGLTTGAGMWLAGAVGLACGLGFWLLAVAATVFALIVIRLIKSVERAIGTRDRPDGR